MYGTKYARMVSGAMWHHVGTMVTSALPADVLHRKFTLCHVEEDNEFSMVLATGHVRGFLTQDVDEEGMMGLQGFQNMVIGKLDNPVKRGVEVSLRVPDDKSLLEAEGDGDAVPGNLVRTTGGPAIDASTTFMKPLSCVNGCLQEAQTGEMIVGYFHRLLTPEADEDNTRILWEWCAHSVPAP